MISWCYYTFATGSYDGWYRRGTYAGRAVCRLSRARPRGVPAGAHVPHAVHVSAGTGAGLGLALVLAVLAWAVARRRG